MRVQVLDDYVDLTHSITLQSCDTNGVYYSYSYDFWPEPVTLKHPQTPASRHKIEVGTLVNLKAMTTFILFLVLNYGRINRQK